MLPSRVATATLPRLLTMRAAVRHSLYSGQNCSTGQEGSSWVHPPTTKIKQSASYIKTVLTYWIFCLVRPVFIEFFKEIFIKCHSKKNMKLKMFHFWLKRKKNLSLNGFKAVNKPTTGIDPKVLGCFDWSPWWSLAERGVMKVDSKLWVIY